MFDLSPFKLLVLAVIALIVFGPNELPKMAAKAGQLLRDLRRVAEGARNDLREGLGPEFAEFEFEDLNPKNFVRKHLLDDLNGNYGARSGTAAAAAAAPARSGGSLLTPGERPPFDPEAT